MDTPDNPIVYIARRTRFILGAIVFLPMTVLFAALSYWDYAGNQAGQVPLDLIVIALLLWVDYIAVAKMIWPPKVTITIAAFSYSNRAFWIDGTYRWDQLDGPTRAYGGYGVPLVQMIVGSTGQKLRFPPSHFGASYEEVAAIIDSARSGHLVAPESWRAQHPRNQLREWVIEWALPIAAGAAVAWFFLIR